MKSDDSKTGANTDMPPGRKSGALLTARQRVALDAVRAFAAFYVVAHHVLTAYDLPGYVAYLVRFGQEAVILFFLLSGAVIALNERDRAAQDVGGYYLRRLRRIYPPMLASMAVSAVTLAFAGALAASFDVKELIGTLLGLQDIASLKPGVIVHPFLGNGPLWSLSYEIVFYLIYPFVLMAQGRTKRIDHWIGLTCIFSYVGYVLTYNHFLLVYAYFAIWWCGAAVALEYVGAATRGSSRIPVLWLAALTAVSAAVVYLNGYTYFGQYPFLMFRHFASALVFVLLLATPVRALVASVANMAPRAMTYLSSISYGVYVLHYPLLVQSPLARSVSGFVLMFALMMVCAHVFDRLMLKYMQRWFPLRR